MKISYRPEIDGLRAIAVGAVIIYHSEITLFDQQIFKGGFLGVDIFFVISGYLITSIILNELEISGKFSFKNFYSRRIRRILPALLLVISVSIPLAIFFILPNNLIDFSKSSIYSLFFSSNYYFHFSGQEYAARDGLFKPLLHTWSLSVEEQYYIIFPISIFLIYKYFKKYLIFFLFFAFFISLILSDWTSNNYNSIAFYSIHTRIWQILAGSILAYYQMKFEFTDKYNYINTLLSIIGLLLIAISFLTFDHNIRHPSFYSLFPILGVCIIIWFSHKDEIVTKILSSKLFVGIGLISYSLYLWHYPIFSFARITAFVQAKTTNSILIGLITFILSILTYHFIEKPFRNRKYRFKSIFFIIVFFYFLIFSTSIFILLKNGKVNYLNSFLEEQTHSPLYRAECKYLSNNLQFIDDNFFSKEFEDCKQKNSRFVLIIGDSHSVDLFNSIGKLSKKEEFIIGLSTKGCRPFDKKIPKCIMHYDNFLNFIKQNKHHIKRILFTHKGSYFLTNIGNEKQMYNSKFRGLPINEIQIQNTIKYLRSIKEISNKLIFIGPHIEINFEFTREILRDLILLNKKIKDQSNYDLILVDRKLKNVSRENNIIYISKIDSINFNFDKDIYVNSSLTFSDTDHWSEFGEIYFGKKLIYNSQIKEILFP